LHPPIPGNDTSTGSFEFRDAPPELCTRNKKFCTTKPNWFYAPMVSCISNSSQCNPIPIVMVLYRSQSSHCSPSKLVRLCRFGQWLADIINVAQLGYSYGKRQNISSSTNPARMGQIGERGSQQRNLISRINQRLHQAITKPRERRFLNHLTLSMTCSHYCSEIVSSSPGYPSPPHGGWGIPPNQLN
jgi:hypothetical protein